MLVITAVFAYGTMVVVPDGVALSRVVDSDAVGGNECAAASVFSGLNASATCAARLASIFLMKSPLGPI